MTESVRYIRIVEWSDEDDYYIGSFPGLFLGGCHGDDERKVFDERCTLVEETIELHHRDGKPLPHPPPNKTSSPACGLSRELPKVGGWGRARRNHTREHIA